MAIPEFVLQKLVVPGSFKIVKDGFSFVLQNNFAPATITRFGINSGKSEISSDCIHLTSSEMGLRASDIQPETPVTLPVGIQITVSVENTKFDDPVRISALTKEVGEIEFSLREVKQNLRFKPLKPTLLSYLAPARHARLTLKPSAVIGEYSPFIFGQFVEHLEACVYNGIWTQDGSRIRQDTLDLINQLNPPIIRYPGGNFASGYHWEDGIGPKEKRPARHDAAWQAEESNQVGTDEFLAFCQEIGSEPYLVVNDGSGTPEEAARWVEYCNGEVTTPQGAIRLANGHPEPYHVKYWGVGNEVWGPWQIGTTGPSEYARRLKRFIKAMKEVDPGIKIVAVGHNPLTDDPEDFASIWNRTILENAGDEIDYLSWHIYQPEKSGWKETYDPLELFRSVSAAHLEIEAILKRVEKQIQENSSGRKILQAVDEWNLWLPPLEGKNVSMHHVTYTMRDALYVTSVLMTFMKSSRTVGMANLAQLVNVLPLIQTNSETAIATAIFYPFILAGQMQPVVIDYSLQSETFTSLELDENVLAHTDVPYVDGISTINPAGTRLSVILVNRYPLRKVKVQIDRTAIHDFLPVKSLSLHANSPEDYNSFERPHKVVIRDGKLPYKRNECWEVTMRPCSVYFIEFENKKMDGHF